MSLLSPIYDLKPEKIRKLHIQKIIDKKVKYGAKYSTVKARLNKIITFFRYLKDDLRLISELPTLSVQVPAEKDVEEKKVLTDMEIKKSKLTSSFDNRILFDLPHFATINRKLQSMCGISLHELRHTYATKLISNGMDFKTATNILGHDIEQTMRTYSHVNDAMLSRAQNLIANIF